MSRFFRRGDSSDSESSSSDEEEMMSSGEEGKAAAPKPAAKPMSRFMRGAGSGSDSESESEEEEEMSEDENKEDGKKPRVSRFLHGGSDDEESDEDTKRVVRSAKDKRLDEMEATGKVIDNGLKINDWVAISSGVWSSCVHGI
jgi:translation initiation factor 3 subunit C